MVIPFLLATLAYPPHVWHAKAVATIRDFTPQAIANNGTVAGTTLVGTAIVRTLSGKQMSLRALPGFSASPECISADGYVIGGTIRSNSTREYGAPFIQRINSKSPIAPLKAPGVKFREGAMITALSPNGALAIGATASSEKDSRGFLYANGKFNFLKYADGSEPSFCQPTALSNSGGTVVGSMLSRIRNPRRNMPNNKYKHTAFKWSKLSGLTAINPSRDEDSYAAAVTGSGRQILLDVINERPRFWRNGRITVLPGTHGFVISLQMSSTGNRILGDKILWDSRAGTLSASEMQKLFARAKPGFTYQPLLMSQNGKYVVMLARESPSSVVAVVFSIAVS